MKSGRTKITDVNPAEAVRREPLDGGPPDCSLFTKKTLFRVPGSAGRKVSFSAQNGKLRKFNIAQSNTKWRKKLDFYFAIVTQENRVFVDTFSASWGARSSVTSRHCGVFVAMKRPRQGTTDRYNHFFIIMLSQTRLDHLPPVVANDASCVVNWWWFLCSSIFPPSTAVGAGWCHYLMSHPS